MRSRIFRHASTLATLLLLVAVPTQASPIKFADVVNVMGDLHRGSHNEQLRLRVAQDPAVPLSARNNVATSSGTGTTPATDENVVAASNELAATENSSTSLVAARLDNLAIDLQNNQDVTAYIFVYAGRTSRTGQADALGRRALDYLVNERGVDGRRINMINGGYREEDYIEIYVCPPGAKAPQASPTVDPSDVQPSGGGSRSRRPRRPRGE